MNPPIMPGWDGFAIPAWFGQLYDAPVLVDNDVNIMGSASTGRTGATPTTCCS